MELQVLLVEFLLLNKRVLKPIIEEFWKQGHQTLFYAEGKWHHHFDAFRELPERSIVFHCDRDDIFEVHRRLHDKFAVSGGIPNVMLSFGKPREVREFCTRVIKLLRRGCFFMYPFHPSGNDSRWVIFLSSA